MEDGLHISIAPEIITTVFGLPITATLITSWLVVLLIVVSAFFIKKNLTVVPGKGQVALETMITFAYEYVKEALGSAARANRYFPLIMSIFIFFVVANLLGLFPFMEAIGIMRHGEYTPLFYPVNADLNVPLALAIISFLTIEISGVIYLGFFKYVGKFINFSSPVAFAVGLLEIIGNLARLISLSFRLFGNILAGHLLLVVIMFFVPYFAPLPFIFFEIFIGIMQAAIFALLTLFFIKIAVEEPHSAH